MEQQSPNRPIPGVLATVLGSIVLTAIAAWAPVAIRKLVLFPVAFGLGCSGIAVWTAREFGLSSRTAVALSLLMTVAGLTAIGLRGHQELHRARAESTDAGPQKMARHLLEAAAEKDPTFAAQLEELRSEENPSFSDYLALRVSPLGEWAAPWPLIFWIAEILLALATAAFIVWRMLSSSPKTVTERT